MSDRFALLRTRLRYCHGTVQTAKALWWFIVGWEGETCHRCGNRYLLWWAPVDLWMELVGQHNGLLCPQCFDRWADDADIIIEWNPRILYRRSEAS